MTDNTITSLLSKAIEAALIAGESIRKVRNSNDLQVEFKSDESPVTIADKKASDDIDKYLKSTNIPIICEETDNQAYSVRKEWPICWMIDPLDGTKEFVRGGEDFTVNIALIENNTPTLGVIYLPIEDTLYFGTKETGAFIFRNVANFKTHEILVKAQKLPLATNPDKLIIVGSISHMNPETEAYVERLISTYGKENVEFVARGSSIKLCLVAEGVANLYPRVGSIMEWDTAAGHAICEAAGCKMTDLDGESIPYNKPTLRQPSFLVFRENNKFSIV